MATVFIAIGTFVLGLLLGGVGGVYYLRKKMTSMVMDQNQIAAMAKNMGMNLNQKQLAQVSKQMKGMDASQMLGGKKRK